VTPAQYIADCPDAASTASKRQPEPPPYIGEPFSKRFDQPIIVIRRRRDAQPIGAAQDVG